MIPLCFPATLPKVRRLMVMLRVVLTLIIGLFSAADIAHAQGADNAVIVNTTMPSSIEAGAKMTVTVTLQNTGSTTWDPNVTNPFRFGSLNDATWGINRGYFTSTVAPGATLVQALNITAPSTPGTYEFRWQMLREGAYWFGETLSRTITVTQPVPVYDAQITAMSIPAKMTAGASYNVALTFKNTGNVTWVSSDYRIGSTSPDDNVTFGPARVNMAASSVAPGQSASFSFSVKAPSTAGTYLFDWGMLWELHWRFGQTTKTYVTVSGATQQPKPTISVSRSAALVAGQSFVTTWSTTNATSLTHVCTASGTGYKINESLAVSGSRTETAQSAWVGYPSTCTWTATGSGGTATYSETVSTSAAPSGSGAVTYIHTDGLGSPVARTDANGQIISRTSYEPYGYVAAGTTPTIGFTGHVNDADTGLTYMQQRYYDPVAGRFLSSDPMATDMQSGAGFNRYVYANNTPYKYVDPDGRNPLAIEAGVGGTFVCGPVCGAVAAGGVIIGGPYVASKIVNWWQSRYEPKRSDSKNGSITGGRSGANSGDKDETKVDPPVPGATQGEKTGGGTRTWTKPGGFDEANKDFDKMNPSNIGDKGNGVRVGTLEDGRRVIVRPDSSDGRPTIEIQRPDGKRAGDKIRYD